MIAKFLASFKFHMIFFYFVESIVKLPYHMPAVLPITHFLKRVPLTDQKKSDRYYEACP